MRAIPLSVTAWLLLVIGSCKGEQPTILEVDTAATSAGHAVPQACEDAYGDCADACYEGIDLPKPTPPLMAEDEVSGEGDDDGDDDDDGEQNARDENSNDGDDDNDDEPASLKLCIKLCKLDLDSCASDDKKEEVTDE